MQAPARSSTTDDPLEILEFALASFRQGGAALATLVEIRGGAARSFGSHVAVSADGSFCGYVSGGCVEAADPVACDGFERLLLGALGSTRTHRKRMERLTRAGFSNVEIDRIKAPIGLFEPTRDATSLALSVLADVAASRLAAYA